jgi:hypothetical protein
MNFQTETSIKYRFEKRKFNERFLSLETVLTLSTLIIITFFLFLAPADSFIESTRYLGKIFTPIAIIIQIFISVNYTKYSLVEINASDNLIELKYLHFNQEKTLKSKWSEIELEKKEAIAKAYIPILKIKYINLSLKFYNNHFSESTFNEFDKAIDELIVLKQAKTS